MDFAVIPISKDSQEWQCSVLKLGPMTVLLNCGWTEAFEPAILEPLAPHMASLDLIVLTHADLKHVGALPYLLAKYNVTCPIVATGPVVRLGELSCVASLEDRDKYRAPLEAFDQDDIIRAFMSRVQSVSYREVFQVHARGRVLTASPYSAGMYLGSAYWVLQCGGHSVAYLVDSGLRRGRHLDGLDLQRLLPQCRGAAQRWDVLITSSPGPTSSLLSWQGGLQGPRESGAVTKALKVALNVREQVLLDETIATLRRGGTVLIPADDVGWIPEVLLVLEAAWAQDRQLATSYPLVWLSSLGDMVLDQFKTHMEYMSSEVLRAFEARFGQNPFVLKSVRIFQTLDELTAAHPLSRPKAVLATSPHLEGGDSRELFMRISAEPRSLIWLLGVPPAKTLARSLLDDFVLKHSGRKDYRLQHHLKQGLPDDQLRAYYDARLMEITQQPASLEPPDLAPPKEEEAPEGAQEAKVKKEEAPRPVQAQDRSSGGAFWSPLGWPGSRTLAHNEQRSEGDEYGHLLLPAELKAWKAQDQEGNKYGLSSITDGSVGEPAKEEVKAEEDLPAVPEAEDSWRALRLQFKEPMHCEVRERVVRVACKVRFVPDGSLEARDLATIVGMMAPKHVVILPSSSDAGKGLARQITSRKPASGAPKVHSLGETGSVYFTLHGLKRKAQFGPEVWPRLSFLKTADGVRLARVRAMTRPPHESADPRIVELAATEAESSPTEPLPRQGGLFVSLDSGKLSLSALKEELKGAEWSKGDLHVDFHAPKASAKPWSSRALSAGGKATMGWAGKPLPEAQRASNEEEKPTLPVLRVEGLPGEEFFLARAALYRRSALL